MSPERGSRTMGRLFGNNTPSCTCTCRGVLLFATGGNAFQIPDVGMMNEISSIDWAAALAVITIIGMFAILMGFYIWAWWKYVRPIQHTTDGDEKMAPQGRGAKQDGNGKRAKGSKGGGKDRDGDGGSSDDDLADRMADLRTGEEKERDIRRRLSTQCSYVGWFTCRENEPPTNPGSNYVYRRCDKPIKNSPLHMANRRCCDHLGWVIAAREDDPWLIRQRKKAEKKKADDEVKALKKDPDDKGGPGGGSKGKTKKGMFPDFMNGVFGTGQI